MFLLAEHRRVGDGDAERAEAAGPPHSSGGQLHAEGKGHGGTLPPLHLHPPHLHRGEARHEDD